MLRPIERLRTVLAGRRAALAGRRAALAGRWVALAGRPWARRALAGILAGLVVAGAVVGQAINERSRGGTAPPPASGAAGGSFLSRLLPGGRGPNAEARVDQLVQSLPPERKLAQLLLVGFRGTDSSAALVRGLEARDLGGVVLAERNYRDPAQLTDLTAAIQDAADSADHIAPLVMAAQEGGRFSTLSELPPAKAPGRLRSASEASRAAGRAARALKRVGVNGVLAPVLDVGLSGGAGIGARAYSDEQDMVAAYGRATVEAYRRARVLSAPKHFPGLGAANQPTDEGPATIGLSLDELMKRDLVPFAAAIAAGAPAIVIGHGLYESEDFVTPASLSRGISTGLLRGQLGFRGLAITDDLASPAIASPIPDAAVQAIAAGSDMVFISGGPAEQEAAYRRLLDAARRGELEPGRIDEALRRVLRAKAEVRLLR